MVAARSRADHGIDRAARKAARLNAAWCEESVARLREFARWQAGFFLIEQARTVIEKDLPNPSDARAWGKTVQIAARLGYIEKTRQIAPAASSNASSKPLWRKGPNA